MKNELREKRLGENFSGLFLGALAGFMVGFLLKEKDKEKLVAFLKEKVEGLGEEVKEKIKELPEKTGPAKKEARKRFFKKKN